MPGSIPDPVSIDVRRLPPANDHRLRRSQQLFEFGLIKTDHGFAINDGDRGSPEAEFQEFLEGGWVLPDVLRHEAHALVRKKLFLLVATASAGLRVDNDLFRHGHLPGGSYRCPRLPGQRLKPLDLQGHYMRLS